MSDLKNETYFEMENKQLADVVLEQMVPAPHEAQMKRRSSEAGDWPQ